MRDGETLTRSLQFETPAEELLPALLGSARALTVAGDDGRILGIVTRDALVRALS